MELNTHQKSLAELQQRNKFLTIAVAALSFCILLLLVKLVLQSEVIIQQTPGMPEGARIERSAMDKGSQAATLKALTAAMVEINPANAEYQKTFIQVFLSPEAYTRISKEIDAKVEQLKSQRELGSYYFVNKGYSYDPKLNKHFVYGEYHTVNAAKDTSEDYVFEFSAHVENYRLVVDDAVSYPGTALHDSEWLAGHPTK